MATASSFWNDPEFYKLPPGARKIVASKRDPDFAKLSPAAQDDVLRKRSTLPAPPPPQPAPVAAPPTVAPPQEQPIDFDMIDAPPPPPQVPINTPIQASPTPLDIYPKSLPRNLKDWNSGPIGKMPPMTGPADFTPPNEPVPPPTPRPQPVPQQMTPQVTPPPRPANPLTPGPTTAEQAARRRRDATGMGRPRLPENQPQAPNLMAAPPVLSEGAKFYANLPPVKAAINAIPETSRNVIKGATKAGLEFAENMTMSPMNAAIMTGTGGLGLLSETAATALSKALGVAFSADMVKNAMERSPEFADAVERGDWENAAKVGTGILLESGAAALGLRHAAGIGEPATPIFTREPGEMFETEPLDQAPPPPPMNRDQRRATAMPPETEESLSWQIANRGDEGKMPVNVQAYVRALDIAQAEPSFGRKMLADRLGISNAAADRMLVRMEQDGVIQRARNANGRDVFHWKREESQQPAAATPAAKPAEQVSDAPPLEPAPSPAPPPEPETPAAITAPRNGDEPVRDVRVDLKLNDGRIVTVRQSGWALAPDGKTYPTADAFDKNTGERLGHGQFSSYLLDIFRDIWGARPVNENVDSIPAAPPQVQEPARPATPPATQGESPNAPLKQADIRGTISNAPTAETPTTPESPDTLRIQFDQLRKGQRSVVMVPNGTELPTDMVPPGFRVAKIKKVGRLYFDPKVTSENNIYRAVKGNRLNELLGPEGGMGAPDKSQLREPASAVVAKSPEGTEVQAVVADENSIPSAVAQAEKVTPPGGNVEIMRPEEVIAEREEGAEPAQSAQPAEPETDLFGNPVVREPQPMSASEKVKQLPIEEINVDPARFQFKLNAVGKGGVTDEFKGVQKFDQEKSGIISVWRDPADGKTYVVNGHHRVEMAQRLNEPTLTVRYLDAPDAQTARYKGALINIAEGRGTSIDAAKVFRDSGLTPEGLANEGISIKGERAAQGMALANLNPFIFEKVVSGEIPVERASIIGSGIKDPGDQITLLKQLEKREASGRRMTNDQVEEMIRLANAGPQRAETSMSLFGEEAFTRSLIAEKAEVSEYVRRRLGQEKKLFAAVGSNAAAERLGATGNVIKAEENAAAAQVTSQAQMLYDKLSASASEISRILDKAAEELADGKPATAVKDDAFRQIRADLVAKAEAYGGKPSQRPAGDGGSGPDQLHGVSDSPQESKAQSASVSEPEQRSKFEVSEERRKSQRGSFSTKNKPSPSYDETKKKFLDRFGDNPQERAALERRMSAWEQANPGRKTVTFDEVREQAKNLDPRLLRDLKPVRDGETLNPAVRVAAESRLNALNTEIIRRTTELESKRSGMSAKEIEEAQGIIDGLDKQARELMDVLIPARSQDGRNLAYHRMTAEKTFDTAYWLGKARKLAGGALPEEVETKLIQATREGQAAEAEGKTAKADHARSKIAVEMMKVEKTGLLDTISALRRAGLLTGVKTHLRNVGGNFSGAVLEEASRMPAAISDIAMSMFSGRRTVQGSSPRAIGKATYEAATRGLGEAWEIMKHGQSIEELKKLETHQELNSGSKIIDAYVNTVFRTMGAEDRVFRVYAYERSLQEQMKLANVTTPTEAMRAQAVADAEFATFNNKNIISDAFSTMKGVLRKKGGAGKALAFTAEMIVPFARTPSNIIARVIDYSGGGTVRAAFKAAQAIASKEFTPEQQRAIAQNIGRGLTGPALIYMGYKLAQAGVMTGTSESDAGARNVSEEAGRLNGAILANGEWRQVSSFSPAGNLMVIGATLHRESTKPLKDELKRPANLAAIGLETVAQQPMLQGIEELSNIMQEPGSRAERALSTTAGSFLPTLLSDVASAGDSVRRDTAGEDTLESIMNAIKVRIPGARQTLPARTSVLGRELPQAKAASVDPTITSEARELTDEVSRELLKNSVKIGKVTSRPGESAKEKALRAQATGKLISRYLQATVTNERYRQLPKEKGDETRKLVLENSVSAARSAINRIVNSGEYKSMNEQQRLGILRQVMQQ